MGFPASCWNKNSRGAHQDVVVLRQLRFPDLLLHLSVCGVHIRMQLGFAQLRAHLLSILQTGFTDGNHHHLNSPFQQFVTYVDPAILLVYQCKSGKGRGSGRGGA